MQSGYVSEDRSSYTTYSHIADKGTGFLLKVFGQSEFCGLALAVGSLQVKLQLSSFLH